MTIGVEEAKALQDATGTALAAALTAHAIGFSEVPTAARYAAIVNAGRVLTTDEAREAWRILQRYADKVRAAGIEVPGLPTPPQARSVAGGRPELAVRGNVGRLKANRYIGHITISNTTPATAGVMKNVAHAAWDNERRWWHAPATPAHAAALLTALADYDPVASERVRELAHEFETLSQRRMVLHPESPEPVFPTSHLVSGALWGHQMRALQFCASSSASLLGIRMGGGKTAAAIATANEIAASRVVIVCPNKVRGVWPREVAKWSARSWHIVDGTRASKRKGGRRQDLKVAERLAQAESNLFDCACGAVVHAAVINYEMLVHEPVASWVPSQAIDLAIYDEVHRAKSPTGTMSKNLARWVDFTHRRVGLSGTPMPQVPWDIFGVYRALDPGIFGSLWTPFRGEYVQMAERMDDGKQFPVAIKKDKRNQFAEKVHSIMYRPTIDLKLPACTHFIRTVEFEPDARTEYNRLEAELWANLSKFEQKVTDEDAQREGYGEEILTPKNVLARLLRLMQFTGGTVPDDEGVDHRVSRCKSDALMEFEGGAPSGGLLYEAGCYPKHPGGVEPVCVYAHFRNDLDAIREVAERAGLRYREISGRRSDGLTDASEMAPDADVVGVQIQSGGTGVDLTRSCYGIWYSKGHSLGDYDQALARQHRPGQDRPVTFVHLEVPETIDHDVLRSLMGHRRVVAGVLAIHGHASPELGGDGDATPPPDGYEWTTGEDMSDGGIVLPIDEFGHDVMGDPRPAKARKSVSTEDMLAFDLDGVL
jgi:hypothetical protein